MRSFKKYLEESSLLQEAEFKIQEKDTTVKKVLEKVSRIQDKEHTYVKVAVLDKNANVESRVYNIEDVTAPSSKRANRTARVKKLTLEYDESVQDEMTLAEFEGILNEYASDESIDARKVLIQAEGSGIVREMNVVFYYDDETNVVFFCVGGYAKLDSVRAFVTRLKAAAAATDNVEGTGSNATADLTDDAREEAVQAVQDGEAPNPNDMPEQTAA
jgi:hypothetical protein